MMVQVMTGAVDGGAFLAWFHLLKAQLPTYTAPTRITNETTKGTMVFDFINFLKPF